MESPDLTVIIPALNEQNTIQQVIDEVLAVPLSKQIIVVDDGSTDKTPEILRQNLSKIEVITNSKPSGKGAAIRSAIPSIRGKVVIIQDADLEYSPAEIPGLVAPILAGSGSVSFGTRFQNGFPQGMALPNKIVNWMLAVAVRLIFGVRISDEATCYKAIRSDLIREMDLQCVRFEFCPEVTAKAIRMGESISEHPISYVPRSKKEGKKIRWNDAPEAFLTLWKYRNWRKKN